MTYTAQQQALEMPQLPQTPPVHAQLSWQCQLLLACPAHYLSIAGDILEGAVPLIDAKQASFTPISQGSCLARGQQQPQCRPLDGTP